MEQTEAERKITGGWSRELGEEQINLLLAIIKSGVLATALSKSRLEFNANE